MTWRSLTFIALTLLGCSLDRSIPGSNGGVHPAGWAEKGNALFHATWLAANKFPLSKCTQCHGADYAGGSVGVSCMKASCHVAEDHTTPVPPDSCTTCHGANGSPRPPTGAHAKHERFCDTCHVVPTRDQVEQHASGDESTIVRFGSFATKNSMPAWDSTQKVCTNTYCHGATSPVWTSSTVLGCDGCHKAPPDNHAPWSRLTSSTASCQTCHPAPDDPRHVNGTVDVIGTACTTCHGSGNHANPPVDLSGSSDPTSRGVGAHVRHLDPALGDRISSAIACTACHVVPKDVLDPGHIVDPTPGRVRFPFGGSYDTQAATCTVWCHFDKSPGPKWTDNSGAARACDGCHGFPPVTTRKNTPHPSVAPDLSACLGCHAFDPSTHVNGVVNFK